MEIKEYESIKSWFNDKKSKVVANEFNYALHLYYNFFIFKYAKNIKIIKICILIINYFKTLCLTSNKNYENFGD